MPVSNNEGEITPEKTYNIEQLRIPVPISPLPFSPKINRNIYGILVLQSPGSENLYDTRNRYEAVIGNAMRRLFPNDGAEDHALATTQTVRNDSSLRSRASDKFDPKEFDPTNLKFKECLEKLSACDLDLHASFVKSTISRYSLCIRKLPSCSEKDIMLAVYFYLEEKFEIQARMELCIRIRGSTFDSVVGVVFDSIQTVEEIFNKAACSQHLRHNIIRNECIKWILNELPQL